MLDHNIKSAAALQRRLEEVGVDISSAQVSRIIYDRPVRANMELLDALATIFSCTANDLLPVRHVTPDESTEGPTVIDETDPVPEAQPVKEPVSTAHEKPKREAKAKKDTAKVVPLKRDKPEYGITGPKLTPLPNPNEEFDDD